MNKFWMMGGAVIAVSVAAMVWNARPVRSSENLLGKAQSEFAAKARDALIQRQMAQTSTAPAPPKSETLSPYVVSSLEPVAAPKVVARETRFEAPAPAPQAVVAPQTVTVAPDAPIASQSVVSSSPSPAAPVAENTPAPKMQLAALPEEPRVSVAPKSVAAVAPVSELAKVDAPVATSTHAAPQRQFKAERKARHVRQERRSNSVGYHSERFERFERSERFERAAPRYITPYDLNSLRARSPELAAAIARYL